MNHAVHDPRFEVGQSVYFNELLSTVHDVSQDEFGYRYLVVSSDVGLPLWLPEEQLRVEPANERLFGERSPHLVVVDQFLKDPDAIRNIALRQDFVTNLEFYKGGRTQQRYLWPGLREEFERLLHCRITDWLDQPMNGVFQITGYDDPLVWHHDTQDYAAALYLTPNAPISAGTSFWRLKTTGSRRNAFHPFESPRFSNDDDRTNANGEMYDRRNITEPHNWELCDRVGAVFNRLAIWDAKLIHSASSYEGMRADAIASSRLVQLFFFSVAQQD
jgi:hypothetical protein